MHWTATRHPIEVQTPGAAYIKRYAPTDTPQSLTGDIEAALQK